jgi:hypothetical protein
MANAAHTRADANHAMLSRILAFYDGHVENRHKSKVWIPEHAQQKPYQPGMWAVNRELWQKNGGGL